MLRVLWLVLSVLCALAAPAAAQEQVDLELVLMVDGSGSVDDDEFTLQRFGYVQALQNPRVLSAIRSGPRGKIALAYVEWSGPELHVPIVPWTVVSDEASILAISENLKEHPRELYGGGTAVGNAILYGQHTIENNAFEGTRRVIDVSGDGPDKDGLPAAFGRDRAVAAGITVNGLPILDSFYGLDVFYLDNVIGGPGAFSIPARTFKDFSSAILTKLIREISGKEPAGGSQQAKDVR